MRPGLGAKVTMPVRRRVSRVSATQAFVSPAMDRLKRCRLPTPNKATRAPGSRIDGGNPPSRLAFLDLASVIQRATECAEIGVLDFATYGEACGDARDLDAERLDQAR